MNEFCGDMIQPSSCICIYPISWLTTGFLNWLLFLLDRSMFFNHMAFHRMCREVNFPFYKQQNSCCVYILLPLGNLGLNKLI